MMHVHGKLLGLLVVWMGVACAHDALAQAARQRERPGEDRQRERGGAEGTEEGMPVPELVPGGRVRPFPQGPWRLGVYAVNTRTGVRITQVIANTPAWNAGLERDDVIVAVNGYQVGSVNGRLYPLGAELQLRADRNGRVSLLVHNQRNRDLVVLEVRLERPRVRPLTPERREAPEGRPGPGESGEEY